MISHNKQFIFIAIPKTGTTSILKGPFCGLRECSEEDFFVKKHNPLADYSSFIDSYFKFAFVRNPWDWVLSWFLYRKKVTNQYNTSGIDFYSWLIDPNTLDPSNPHVGPHIDQHKYLLSSGKINIDFLGKFEVLQEDFNTVCDQIDVPHKQLPRLNKTDHKHYIEYYDDRTRKIITDRYAKDIEYFGYEFGG